MTSDLDLLAGIPRLFYISLCTRAGDGFVLGSHKGGLWPMNTHHIPQESWDFGKRHVQYVRLQPKRLANVILLNTSYLLGVDPQLHEDDDNVTNNFCLVCLVPMPFWVRHLWSWYSGSEEMTGANSCKAERAGGLLKSLNNFWLLSEDFYKYTLKYIHFWKLGLPLIGNTYFFLRLCQVISQQV